MKFRKFGKALLMSALSVGAVLSVTSCVQSYTVGYLYVTGNLTSGSNANANGIISGFKIDHNTGNLVAINGLPIGSGGANPGRAVLLTGSRFLYVLNRGTNAEGGTTCTLADPCNGANITQFSVGGNGVLAQQETFYTQGKNPFRLIGDSSGNFLYALDHDAPLDANSTTTAACLNAFSSGNCGDITAFQVNQSTGRLTTIVNAQVTAASGASALPYFPVPANPIDFTISSGFVETLSGTPGTGDSVFPYTFSSSGQLTVNQNSSQPLNIAQATALVYAGGYMYVLDNEPITIPAGAIFPAGVYNSQILPFSIGTNGALQAQTGGAVPDDPAQSNPIYLILEAKGKWVYVANQGDNLNTQNTQSGIVGYILDSSTHQLRPMAGSPFGSGAGPQCMLEDPSNQFIYTANFNDSTVTGRVLDENEGVLNDLPGKADRAFPLSGPAAWCVISGRTS